VFIDYQNVYMRAREAFAAHHAPAVEGQILPLRLGLLLTQRGRLVDPDRRLASVKIFRGEPSPRYSPVGQAACQRQVEAWSRQAMVEPVTRPIQYRIERRDAGRAIVSAREKGIDVLLALSIALGAERDDYDTAVLFSADTDLLPSLEHARSAGKVVEVAAWKPESGHHSRLRLEGMWCHHLDRRDYERVVDRTNYALGKR